MPFTPEDETGNPRACAQASGAYWAARLLERKRAEEGLRAEYDRLTRRVDLQSSQLSVISETLRQERAESEHLGALAEQLKARLQQRVDNQLPSAGGEDWSARLQERERVEESLRAELVEVRQQIERQAAEIRRLDEALRQESRARAGAEAELVEARAEFLWTVEQGRAAVGEEWAAAAGEQKRAVEALRSELTRVGQQAERQAGEITRLSQAATRESAARKQWEAAFEHAQAALSGEVNRSTDHDGDVAGQWIEWKHWKETQQETLAQIRQRADEQGSELRSLEETLQSEAAGRKHSEDLLQEQQAELEQRIVEGAGRLEKLAEAFEGGGAERERLEGALEGIKAELEQRIAEGAGRLEKLAEAFEGGGAERERLESTLLEIRAECGQRSTQSSATLMSLRGMLEREVSERRESHNSLQEIYVEAERRVGEYSAELHSINRSLSREVGDRTSMEAFLRQVQAELDRRVAGQAAELEGIKGAVAQEISERKDLGAGLERLERAQADLDRRIGEHTPGFDAFASEAQEEAPEPQGGELALRDSSELAGITRRGNGALVASVVPEICVPINGIVCMTDLALDTDLTEAQRDYLERVKSLAEAVLALISGGGGAGEGEMPPCDGERAAFRLREHLRDTLKPLLSRAHQKGLELTCHIAPKVPNGVLGDPAGLRQVLANLVGNAIKFTGVGEVSVCVDTASQTTSEAILLITVADGGAGIPVAQQGAVFDALAGDRDGMGQADASTGLGLAVSSELVRGMGGRIWFESEVDHGTSFRFTIRLGLQDDGESRPAWAVWRSARRHVVRRAASSRKDRAHEMVLLAENDPRERHGLKKLLEDRGYAAITVEDGRGVLAAMENDSFDLVIMDLRMPGMDAFEAAAAFRALERANGVQTPIVVLAGDATEADRRRCLAVGIDAWVTKPIRASALFAVLEPLLSKAEPLLSKAAERED